MADSVDLVVVGLYYGKGNKVRLLAVTANDKLWLTTNTIGWIIINFLNGHIR